MDGLGARVAWLTWNDRTGEKHCPEGARPMVVPQLCSGERDHTRPNSKAEFENGRAGRVGDGDSVVRVVGVA